MPVIGIASKTTGPSATSDSSILSSVAHINDFMLSNLEKTRGLSGLGSKMEGRGYNRLVLVTFVRDLLTQG